MTTLFWNEAQFTDNPNAAQIARIYTDASLATITATGWANALAHEGFVLSPKNKYLIAYNAGAAVDFFNLTFSGGNYTFSIANTDVVLPTIANHIAVFTNTTGTLSEDVATAINGGNIQAGLDATAGTLASYPSTTLSGKLIVAAVNNSSGNFNTTISNAAAIGQSQVISIPDSGATTANFILSKSGSTQHITAGGLQVDGGSLLAGLAAGGTAGSLTLYPPTTANGFLEILPINAGGAFNTIVSNSAMGQTSTISIPDPGVATSKFLLTNSASGQTIATGGLDLSVGSVRALQGNFQAGSDAHAGTFTSFPGTTGNGSFVIAALNAGGAFTTTLKNSIMGQSSVVSIPDPANAVGQLLIGATATPFVSGNLIKASGTAGVMADQGFAMKSVAQAVVAGGNAAQTVTDAFCTTGSMVVACWNDTTNAVDIQKVAAGNGSFVVTSSGDPGASHLNYIITK